MRVDRFQYRWLTLLLVFLLQSTSLASEIVGQVIGVLDGDTIDVLTPARTQVRVRLAGIDAPEKGQPFGTAAKRALSGLLYGKPVTIDSTKTDRYGRTVGKVFVNDVDANLVMVASGFAWHYKQYAMEQSSADRERYAVAENAARARSVGLWRDRKPMPPWEHRRRTTPKN